jgi:hypothetical protein
MFFSLYSEFTARAVACVVCRKSYAPWDFPNYRATTPIPFHDDTCRQCQAEAAGGSTDSELVAPPACGCVVSLEQANRIRLEHYSTSSQPRTPAADATILHQDANDGHVVQEPIRAAHIPQMDAAGNDDIGEASPSVELHESLGQEAECEAMDTIATPTFSEAQPHLDAIDKVTGAVHTTTPTIGGTGQLCVECRTERTEDMNHNWSHGRCRPCWKETKRAHKRGQDSRTCATCRENLVSTSFTLEEWMKASTQHETTSTSQCISC